MCVCVCVCVCVYIGFYSKLTVLAYKIKVNEMFP